VVEKRAFFNRRWTQINADICRVGIAHHSCFLNRRLTQMNADDWGWLLVGSYKYFIFRRLGWGNETQHNK